MRAASVVCGMMGIAVAGWAVNADAAIINDGSTTANLTLVNSPGEAPGNGAGGQSMTSDGSVITLAGSRDRRLVAYSNVAPSAPQYTVSAEATKATYPTENNRRVGVIGWYDTTAQTGIGMYRNVNGVLRLRSFDLTQTGGASEGVGGLFTTGGAAYSGDFGSGAPDNQAVRYSLTFAAPTSADLSALPAATARITATATDLAGTNVYGTSTALTNLAVPTDHRVGYFGYLAENFTELTLGTYDNLDLTVVPEPTAFGLLGAAGLLALRRRRRNAAVAR